MPLFITFILTFICAAWPKVWLLDESGHVIRLKFEVPRYEIGTEIIDGALYASIIEPSEPPTSEKGFPEVPYYARSVTIGNRTSATVRIIDIKYKEMKIGKLIPSRGRLKRTRDPRSITRTFGDIYTRDRWYPEKNVTISEPFIIRNVRGVTVTFYPFQCNAVTGALRIAEEIVVAVTPSGLAKHARSTSLPKITSRAFSDIHGEVFVNHSASPDASTISDGDGMLIIAAEKYKGKMNDFVEWKMRKGIRTTVHAYPSETGSGADGIRNFIKKKFGEDRVTYVLLVGNGTDIPGNGDLKDRDPPYSLLTDDMYPDVFVGRFCVDDDKQLQTIISKSIRYEKEPDIEGAWYGNALLNGSKAQDFSPQADWKWMVDFADSLKKGGYANTVVYSENGSGGLPAGTVETTSSAINNGISWFTYMGHGNPFEQKAPTFKTSDILNLTNHGKYGVCLSIACSNGAYNTKNIECLGQTWTVAGTPEQGKGGIVYLGSSIEPDWVPPQYGAQCMMKVIARKNGFHSVGNIVYNGHVQFLTKYNGDPSDTFATWNYFGDPSIHLRFAPPVPLDVVHPGMLDKGTHTIDVEAPDNTIVCVYGKSQNIWQTKRVSEGRATFTIKVANSADSIYVTGNGKNTIPYLGVINGRSEMATGHSMATAKMEKPFFFNTVTRSAVFTFPESYAGASVSVRGVNGIVVYSKNSTSDNGNSFSWNVTTGTGAKLAIGIYHVAMVVRMKNGSTRTSHDTFIYQR